MGHRINEDVSGYTVEQMCDRYNALSSIDKFGFFTQLSLNLKYDKIYCKNYYFNTLRKGCFPGTINNRIKSRVY